MSSSIPLKVALGDLTPLEVHAPTASRSGIVRALIVGVVAKNAPLAVSMFDPPKASSWTTVAVDTATEILINKAFQTNNAKNLSALVFNAVRDPDVVAYAKDFLNLSAAAKRKRVDEVLLVSTGSVVASGDESSPDEESEQAQRSHLLRFVVEELEEASKVLDAATARHTSAKLAFDALQRILGETSASA